MSLTRVLACATGTALATAAVLLACGPFLTDFRSVQTIAPAHPETFARGSVGVVRPKFARRYLVQAYRRFSGQSPLVNTVDRPAGTARPTAPVAPPIETWWAFRDRALGEVASPARQSSYYATLRSIGNYQTIDNCLDEAFVAALRTGKARSEQFGADSAALRDWVRAQDAVFANCAGGLLVLPDPAPPDADPVTRADRAYQAAAAYFYAMRYDEAAPRFRAIAADSSSPWRSYGRYLGARALIRQGTIPDPPDAGALARAEAELRQVLDDPAAAALHGSTRGLLDFVVGKARPVERLRAVSRTLTSNPSVGDQDLRDYQRLMDRLVGDTTEYDYDGIDDREAIIRSGDLNDWVIAMQGSGDGSLRRALEQWDRTGRIPWLVAALWKIEPRHEEAPVLLTDAARVPRSSPAFATLAFLRVRLLAARGDAVAARALLAALPSSVQPGFEAETLNLFAAQRMMLAANMQELLASAPRTVVADATAAMSGPPSKRVPVFDADAEVVLSQRLPLARLVEAATDGALPDRLTLKIAAAAFTRALLLKRHDAAQTLVPVLRRLAPVLRGDLDRFERASSAGDRHIAGLLLLLRTPGMRARIFGPEDDESLRRREAARTFDHTFRRNWWCSFAPGEAELTVPDSEVLRLVYRDEVPAPSFLTADERAALRSEVAALAEIGPAPNYLAREAVNWAKSRPNDVEAAEALALAVEGTRWGCVDAQTSAASKRAFQTLHLLFPTSEWARRTKYWY